MAVQKKNENALTILDQETGQFVEVTHETQRLASYVHNQVLMGAFISAVSIKKIFDEKLYLGLNCGSKDEYCSTMLPFGIRQAQRLYQIANKFDAVSKSLTGNGLIQITSGDTLENTTLMSHDLNANELAQLGMAKLYELTKLEDENIKDLIKEGKTKVADHELLIEEIKDASAKELSKIISETTKKYKSKISQLTEEVALLKEEKNSIEKDFEKLQAKKEEIDEIEMQYGPTASLLADKKRRLSNASALLNEFVETFVKAGVTDEDPESIRRDVQDLIRRIDEVHSRCSSIYDTVILE